ncbi:cap-specific mRNA (nucleoside-2'-O-)-methyltransferase 1 [Planococcus citri]|uniref:cap-specific mRNA (nucleoside-2'-O-)-methyltransferase 1 n=1 Tax=Planococcus citri TaxID=170843 RepID=UPI0031F98C89
MSSRHKKSKKCRGDAPVLVSPPPLPSLYADNSDVKPHFKNAFETLSDSDDDEDIKSTSSGSANGRFNDTTVEDLNHWGLQDSDTDMKNDSCSSPPQIEVISSKKSKKRKTIELTDDDYRPAKKKKKDKEKDEDQDAVFSSQAEKMMKMMGYKKGEGLGKHGQGRVAPVDASKHKGRRGLGLQIAEVDRDLIQYNAEEEIYTVHEEVQWLYGVEEMQLSDIDLREWIVHGKKKRILDDETHFCDASVLKQVLICKTAFDKMGPEEKRRARSRSNPYELIKKGPFLNRAAMKMANMDNVFDYIFTNPVDEYRNPMVGEHQLLYFADVCAGPGGFSEYVLWRKKWQAKGFGFTLKGDNDFKLEDFYAGPCESFEPFYGEAGDGDVYKSVNIRSFKEHVLKHTDYEGVHFMMADGGFCVEGNENIQEILSKRIYLCQCLVALSIVRKNGHFVCKLFDVFTPFSVGIIYLMYNCFKKISIHKPNTSRPANSERYIICKWRNDNVDFIRDYMYYVNELLDQCGESNDDDISELVPLAVMKDDVNFYDYIVKSNNCLGKRQINSLAKIVEYSEDETLVEEKQNQLKKDCMDAWEIPIKARREPSREQPEFLCRKLLENDSSFLRQTPKNILTVDMCESLYTVYDWHAVILGSNREATFYLCASHRKCYRYETASGKWVPVSPINECGLELSPETLVYGEIVPEVIGTFRGQRKINVFHIIDGYMLGGKNISQLDYTERIIECSVYAKALTRPSLLKVMPIRMKTVFDLERIEDDAFCKMDDITMKNGRTRLAVPVYDAHNAEQFFLPKGIMFLRATKLPYRRFYSTTNNMKYYWAPKQKALFDKDRPTESIASFKDSYSGAFTWYMNEEEDSKFNRQEFVKELVHYVRTKKNFKKDEK